MDIIITILEHKNQLKAAGYAKSSINHYIFYLNQFKEYLKTRNITDLKEVTHKIILEYQEYLATQATAMETRALKIRAVKRLFEYLTNTHKLLINPTEGIVETCRINRKIQITLTLKEIKALLSAPNLSLKTGIRDRGMLEAIYSTAIRLNELISLEVYHADLKDRVLYIRKGKGGKKRVVPLSKEAVRYLKEYTEHIRPYYAKKNPKERRLFLNHSGRPLNTGSVQAILRKYRMQARIRKPVSPHTIRRTCATHMLQNGADIRYIQKLLGHRHLSTTQTYTKVMPVDIKKTHNKTHPGKEIRNK